MKKTRPQTSLSYDMPDAAEEPLDAAPLFTNTKIVSGACVSLLLDDDKPRSDDRTQRTASSPARRRCRACGRRRSGTALRLEQVSIVRLRIDGNRLCAGKRIDRRYHGVLVW